MILQIQLRNTKKNKIHLFGKKKNFSKKKLLRLKKEMNNELIERISKVLECPICLEKFINPKILPCSHTFCLRCLIPENNKIKCALCRTEHNIPSSGTLAFSTNRQIEDLLEINLITTNANDLNKYRETINREEVTRTNNTSKILPSAPSAPTNKVAPLPISTVPKLPRLLVRSSILVQPSPIRTATPTQPTIPKKIVIGCQEPISIGYVVLVYVLAIIASLIIIIINAAVNK
jgi:hypothetical protein